MVECTEGAHLEQLVIARFLLQLSALLDSSLKCCTRHGGGIVVLNSGWKGAVVGDIGAMRI